MGEVVGDDTKYDMSTITATIPMPTKDSLESLKLAITDQIANPNKLTKAIAITIYTAYILRDKNVSTLPFVGSYLIAKYTIDNEASTVITDNNMVIILFFIV